MSAEGTSAVILAAGEGSRLEPLTKRRPKPMLPIANKPLLEHVISAVVQAGITHIVLVVGYERDRIQTYFGDGDDWNVTISYASQEQQLGTAHAVLQTEELVDNPFLVLNGDRIIDSVLVEEVHEELKMVSASSDGSENSADAIMGVTRSNQPNQYGVVSLDGDMVTGIIEKPTGDSPSEIINAGVYGFQPDIFDTIRKTTQSADGEYELPTTVNTLLSSGTQTLRAVRYDGRWLDVSHPWDLLTVTGQLLDDDCGAVEGTVETGAQVSDIVYVDETAVVGKNTVVGRGTTLGENVKIGPNVTIERSVVFSDATIEAGAVVRDSIIGANATVGDNVTIPRGEASVVLNDGVHHNVQLGAVLGDNTKVGGGSVVHPGTTLGDTVTVTPGTAVRGAVADRTEVRNG